MAVIQRTPPARRMRRYVIQAPPELCVYQDDTYTATFRFLAAIVDTAIMNRVPITLDLRKVKYFSAGASLMLFAHVSAAQVITGQTDIVRLLVPDDKVCRREMVRSGLFFACRPGGVTRLEKLWGEESRFLSGMDPEADYIRSLEAIERELRAPASEDVCRALAEAILNVSHHAYEFLDSNNPLRVLNKRWWQRFEVGPDGLSMLLYDMGMGIARTLEPQILGGADELLLQRAMTKGESRLKEKGRGQGSVDIKRPVVGSDFTSLFMLTNAARLQFSTRHGIDATDRLTESVRGTYIEWHNQAPARTSNA